MMPKDKKITLPTLITLVRILLIPCVVYAIMVHQWGWALLLSLIAALTDTIDGHLARFLGEQSFLGACLDPLADKLFVLSCFFALSYVQGTYNIMPSWVFWLLVAKELILVSGAAAMYVLRGALDITPTRLGKATMFAQLLFIEWILLCAFLHQTPGAVVHMALFSIVLLALMTLVQYAMIGLRLFFRFLL